MSTNTVFLGLPTLPVQTRVSANDLGATEVDLVITSNCNLSKKCIHCYLTQDFLHSHQTMSLGMIRAILAWAKGSSITFNLLGGEPSLHPQFGEIVELIATAGFRVSVVTNGGIAFRRKLEEPIHSTGYGQLKLGESGFLSYIALSVEGPYPEIHDFVRGPGSFAQVKQSAGYLRQYQIPFGLNWTVLADTAMYDLDMTGLAREWGAKRLNVHVISIGEHSTATERAADQHVPPGQWRGIWRHLLEVMHIEAHRPSADRLQIDCEVPYDFGFGDDYGPNHHLRMYGTISSDGDAETNLCNVRRPKGITIYPNGNAITCPLHSENPEVGSHLWRDDSLFQRKDPHDEAAMVAAVGDCIGCPKYHAQTDSGATRLCVLTRMKLLSRTNNALG